MSSLTNGNDLGLRPMTWWERLRYNVLPGRCVFCYEWKLHGKKPHKRCEEYELWRADRNV